MTTLYQLEPRTLGFHFGEEGLELEVSRVSFPSDSLFAALVATVAEQEGGAAAADFAAPFEAGAPPFRLTSLFPYAGRLPLLPLPLLRIRFSAEAAQPPRKFLKRVSLVSPGIFGRLVRGEPMDAYVSEAANGRFLQDRGVWLTADEVDLLPEAWLEPPAGARGSRAEQRRRLRAPEVLMTRQVWQNGRVTRVALDRASSRSAVYLMGRVSFNAGCGLWLGVDYADAVWRPRLEMLLHHLGDRGIGGERSSGYGAFRLADPPRLVDPLPADAAGDYQVLLSRYLPREAEMEAVLDASAAYQLVTVGGWLTSPRARRLRRRRLTLLAAGSVVRRPADGGITGRLQDVRPDWDGGFPHPVWRCGLPLTAPVANAAVAPEEAQP